MKHTGINLLYISLHKYQNSPTAMHKFKTLSGYTPITLLRGECVEVREGRKEERKGKFMSPPGNFVSAIVVRDCKTDQQ